MTILESRRKFISILISISWAVLLLILTAKTYAQVSLPDGYPDRSASFDVLPGFVNPPKGYGEVPFYWWQGDTLTRERITWQLDQLQNKRISSLQINYSHIDEGGISYGLSNPSKPALFTDAWWDLFKWFASEAQKRGMTVSLSDYTLGVGQGFAMDEALKEYPDMNGSVLKAEIKIFTGKCEWSLPKGVLNLTACKLHTDSSLLLETRTGLLQFVKDGKLSHDFGNDIWKVFCVNQNKVVPSYDPMHPQSGKAYTHYFFDKFEKALPAEASKALNFFFSDELNFCLNGNLWNTNFQDQFKKRKGYDVVPYLDALFIDIGTITPKIRLDYNEVMVSLSEENFFIPVYNWHHDRGLIYGCDHGGRGKDVGEFGDYFRTQRWNQGPGSDQPFLLKDLIKTKVAASIAHLYERPRVWLEGFHSSGWGTSSADLADAIFANYVAGYNLISFHGLYYSIQGGWWEWAPPCNHFRMPYWQQIDPLMQCTERLSYILSQGHHLCDIAIIYPTEPVVANMDGEKSVNVAFGAGNMLYDKGVDFDFIDYESIARAEAKNGELHVSGEKYKILVVPSMKVIRYSTLKKMEEFRKAGGIILNVGAIPEVTEKGGENAAEVSELIKYIFSESKNSIRVSDQKLIFDAISGLYTPDFKILSEIKERPYSMHRTIGNRDLYALYNFPQGSKCFFKTKGNVQLWNPWNGEVKSISEYTKQTAYGTEIILPLSDKEIQLIVFSPIEIANDAHIADLEMFEHPKQTLLDNNWEFELKPSLDNQWGDFQLPATHEMMGAQVRQLYLKENFEYGGEELTIDSSWNFISCAYGTQFLKLGPLNKQPSVDELVKMVPEHLSDTVFSNNRKYLWEKYKFSWQRGVEGDYGHQGYHGLKGNMYDNFIRLGLLSEEKHSKFRKPEPDGNYYVLYTTVLTDADGAYDLLTGSEKPTMLLINNAITECKTGKVLLRKGNNTIIALYDKSCETYLVFRKPGIPRPAKQQISMCWYGDSGVLPFDCSNATSEKSGLFVFNSAPGLQSLSFKAYGKVKFWVDGKEITPIVEHKQADGLTSYKANLENVNVFSSQVVVAIAYQPGYTGGAAIPGYFRQQCGRSMITLGDWSTIDGLRAYSGGAIYRKSIFLNENDIKGKLVFDLGQLVSSGELTVNGKSAGIKVSPPWNFDISNLVKSGENKIEVLVYNTLANNYTSVPTRYRGEIVSGLIGPVIIYSYQPLN